MGRILLPSASSASSASSALPKMLPSYTPSTATASTPPAASRKPRHVTDFTVKIPGSTARPNNSDTTSTSRWRSPEFMLYGAVFVLVVPWMVYWPMRLSSASHPNYPAYSHRLSDGWLFGRKVDNSDAQYRSFRSNLLALLALASTYLLTSAVQSRASPSPHHRAIFITIFAALMLIILHGISALKIFAILYGNFVLARWPKPPAVAKVWPALVIGGNMILLFLNERYDGYKLGQLHAIFDSLDAMGGILPRWHVSFNITMLRIVSFACDYHWREPVTTVETPSDYRNRVTRSLTEEDYSLINFLAYCLYPPLYIAGPIITFNDFVWQLKRPLEITWKEKLSYAIRFVFCLLTMESVLHTMHVVAIKDTSAWAGDGPADLSMIGFWNLVVVWLKLLIPWRFFRMWALLDGLDPPENMVRCVANNYSTLGFWRSWHRSYNLWIVRYIYIPVGGAKRVVLATTLVFTFVALWHDLSFKLLAWGWLISLFILPELVARRLLPFDKVRPAITLRSRFGATLMRKQYGHESWYRHVAAAGGVINILFMMSANLVGFVLGLDGMKHLVRELAQTPQGWVFTLFSCSCLFVAVQVMFEYREEERRRGIDRRC
ncbi:Glycerol uptake protein 1 [Saitozyma sp. JCM 24511]|nr:Glycerol uptake protein 1 [Saitozyma sp. JCM 24511]